MQRRNILSIAAVMVFLAIMFFAVSGVSGADGPYGIGLGTYSAETSSITVNIAKNYSAGMSQATSELTYSSYIFTTDDLVFFSYEDGTQLEVYDSNGDPVSLSLNVLDKGEHVYVDTSQGVYLVAGSNRFAVLTGDATDTDNGGVSGYYAMNAIGRGTSEEFYTYVPRLYEHCEFIVFAYADDTNVTIREDSSNGVYLDIASFTLDKGEHWSNSSLSDKYLHVTADKPVSALTSYDQSYFVPSADGLWTGTEFYTYANDIGDWPEDLTVIAYDDNTAVNIKDSDSQATIWSGTLDSGQAHVEQYPSGADKYFTITTDKTAAVSIQPWKSSTSDYYQGVFVPDRDGTGTGTDLIGSTQTGGYLYILGHTDNTNVDLYNSETDTWQASYTLDRGEAVDGNPGNGLWRIISDEGVSVHSGWGSNPIANFAPLSFNQRFFDFTNTDDVNDLDCTRRIRKLTYTICWEELNNLTLEDVRIIDYLPYGVTCPSGHWDRDLLRWIEDTNYDPNNHTYTWDIGTIYPYDANCVSLTVTVNRRAEPGLELHNEAELVSGGVVWAWTFKDTLVCCWDMIDPDIIYVDETATRNNNGTSWRNAYTDLQDALYRAYNI